MFNSASNMEMAPGMFSIMVRNAVRDEMSRMVTARHGPAGAMDNSSGSGMPPPPMPETSTKCSGLSSKGQCGGMINCRRLRPCKADRSR